jgi:hypothetical protein
VGLDAQAAQEELEVAARRQRRARVHLRPPARQDVLAEQRGHVERRGQQREALAAPLGHVDHRGVALLQDLVELAQQVVAARHQPLDDLAQVGLLDPRGQRLQGLAQAHMAAASLCAKLALHHLVERLAPLNPKEALPKDKGLALHVPDLLGAYGGHAAGRLDGAPHVLDQFLDAVARHLHPEEGRDRGL